MNFLTILLSTGAVMSVIMLALVFVFRANSDLLSAKTRYTIWIIILVGLLIPFRPQLISPLFTLNNPFTNVSEVKEQGEIDLTAQSSQKANVESKLQSANQVSNVQSNEVANTKEDSKKEETKFDLLSLIGKFAIVVWLIGAIVVFVRYMLDYRKFSKLLKRWSSPVEDEDIIRIFRLTKLKLDIENKDIGLIRSKYVNTPMLTGLIRPMVVIPEKEIDEMDMKLIIEHELTHYKHKDLYVNLLSILVLCFHWFNPIMYYCMPVIQGDGELYCDETVLKNKNMNYRKTYGKMIINMIPTSSSKQVALSTCFYSKKLSVKRRLISIMKNNKAMKKISTLSILGILGVTVLSGSLMTFAANSSYIGLEKAKSIALKDAGVSGVTFVKAKLDNDDGVRVYDIEFYKDNVEYDYEIDAITGQIREKDLDIENYTIPQNKNNNSNNSADIGVERAKSIALRDAGVSGVTFVKAKLDYENGVRVYDIEFYKDNVEYDYEIDAATGQILEKDREIENYSIPQKKVAPKRDNTQPQSQNQNQIQSQNQTQSQNQIQSQNQPQSQNQTQSRNQPQTQNQNQTQSQNQPQTQTQAQNYSADIGAESAKSIALGDAGVSGVNFTKVQIDYEDGVKVYDVEFHKDNTEYEYEIDAATGSIRERNVDEEDD
ncbi:peptidase, M56 family [Peptostreptococcaceae bacterium AS15]|nr:peptidase, M56 family [Peptostreptococcaceae bacterium AS15]